MYRHKKKSAPECMTLFGSVAWTCMKIPPSTSFFNVNYWFTFECEVPTSFQNVMQCFLFSLKVYSVDLFTLDETVTVALCIFLMFLLVFYDSYDSHQLCVTWHFDCDGWHIDPFRFWLYGLDRLAWYKSYFKV